jgi:hypothetical protein
MAVSSLLSSGELDIIRLVVACKHRFCSDENAGQPKALESPGKANDARILAEEIAEGLRDALEQIESVLADLKTRVR